MSQQFTGIPSVDRVLTTLYKQLSTEMSPRIRQLAIQVEENGEIADKNAKAIASLKLRVGEAEAEVRAVAQVSSETAEALAALDLRASMTEQVVEGHGLQLGSLSGSIEALQEDVEGLAEDVAAITGSDGGSLSSRVTAVESSLSAQSSVLTDHANLLAGLELRTTSVETDIQSIFPRLDDLESDMEAVTGSDGSLTARITALESTAGLHAGLITDNADALSALQLRTTSVETEMAAANAQIGGLGQQLTSFEARMASLESSADLHATLITDNATSISGLSARTTQVETTTTGLSNGLNAVGADVADLKATTENIQSTVNTQAQIVSDHATTIAGLSAKTTQNETTITALSGSLDDLNENFAVLDNRLDTVQQRVSTVESTVSAQASQITSHGTAISGLSARTGQIETTYVQVVADLSEAEAQLSEAEAQLSTLESTVTRIDADLSLLSELFTDQGYAVSGLTARTEVVEQEVAEHGARLASTEADLAAAKDDLETLTTTVTTISGTLAAQVALTGEHATAISGIEGRTAIVESNVENHEDRLVAAEAFAALQAQINTDTLASISSIQTWVNTKDANMLLKTDYDDVVAAINLSSSKIDGARIRITGDTEIIGRLDITGTFRTHFQSNQFGVEIMDRELVAWNSDGLRTGVSGSGVYIMGPHGQNLALYGGDTAGLYVAGVGYDPFATRSWVQSRGYLTSLPSHGHPISAIIGLQGVLDGKAAVLHNHNDLYARVTDFQMPFSAPMPSVYTKRITLTTPDGMNITLYGN